MSHEADAARDSTERERQMNELMTRAVSGDATAREELLLQELPRLRAFIRLRTGAALRARESTSDLLQSVCREILADLGKMQFQGSAAFRHWLFKTAEHKIIDRARHHEALRRTPSRSEDVADSVLRETFGTLITPSREAAAREEVLRLEEAFAKLSPDHREVITLAKIVGLSHREIGEAMDRTEAATRMLLFRALAELSDLVQGTGSGDRAPS